MAIQAQLLVIHENVVLTMGPWQGKASKTDELWQAPISISRRAGRAKVSSNGGRPLRPAHRDLGPMAAGFGRLAFLAAGSPPRWPVDKHRRDVVELTLQLAVHRVGRLGHRLGQFSLVLGRLRCWLFFSSSANTRSSDPRFL